MEANIRFESNANKYGPSVQINMEANISLRCFLRTCRVKARIYIWKNGACNDTRGPPLCSEGSSGTCNFEIGARIILHQSQSKIDSTKSLPRREDS